MWKITLLIHLLVIEAGHGKDDTSMANLISFLGTPEEDWFYSFENENSERYALVRMAGKYRLKVAPNSNPMAWHTAEDVNDRLANINAMS